MGSSGATLYRFNVICRILLLLVWFCSTAARSQYSNTSLTVSDVVASRSNLVRPVPTVLNFHILTA